MQNGDKGNNEVMQFDTVEIESKLITMHTWRFKIRRHEVVYYKYYCTSLHMIQRVCQVLGFLWR